MNADLQPRSLGYRQEGIRMTGQCFCGSVAFEFEGPTRDIQLQTMSARDWFSVCCRIQGASKPVSLAAGRGANFILRRADTQRTTRVSAVLLQDVRFASAKGICWRPRRTNPHRFGRW
jgi:hypothetical protein